MTAASTVPFDILDSCRASVHRGSNDYHEPLRTFAGLLQNAILTLAIKSSSVRGVGDAVTIVVVFGFDLLSLLLTPPVSHCNSKDVSRVIAVQKRVPYFTAHVLQEWHE